MIIRFICSLLLLASLTAATSSPVSVGISVTSTGSDEEFVGPFANWINAKTGKRFDGTGSTLCTGATGNGSTDDAAALQSCLDILGATNPVLWIPAGTYKINSTLTCGGTDFLNIIAEDPSTTTIIWGGASSGTMLAMTGSPNMRINRLNWNGNGTAGTIIDNDFSSGLFNTGLEFADDIFQNGQYGQICGHSGGCADTVFIRDKFLNNSIDGILVNNFNALDVWVWYSLFQNNPRAITNVAGGGSAGQFHVFNSIFENSTTADASTANTFGTTNLRGNYSIGSRRFWEGGGSGAVEPITIQGNTILDPTNPHAIYEFSSGPIVLIDNVIRSSGGTPVAEVPPDRTLAAAGIFSMGNTFTVGTGTCAMSAPVYSTGPCYETDDRIVSSGSVNPSAPTLPGVPPNHHRTIYEATNVAGIISGIASAAGTCDNSVVHIQAGSYSIPSTITVPASCPIQIIGDGGNSFLGWAGSGTGPELKLVGPSKVVLRDFRMQGDTVAAGIEIAGADQAQARIFGEQVSTAQGSPNLLVDALDYTNVEFHDSKFEHALTGFPSINVVGGPSASSGSWLGGVTKVFAALSWGVEFVYQSSAGARLLLQAIWNEASTTSFVSIVRLTDGGSVTLAGTMLGQTIAAPTATGGSGSNTLTLNSVSGITAGMYAGIDTGEIPDHDVIDSINTGAVTIHLVSPTLAALSAQQIRVYVPIGISMNNFFGTAALVNNFTFGGTEITGASPLTPKVLGIQSGPDTWFANTSSPPATAELCNSSNNIDFNAYTSTPPLNCSPPDAAFLRTTLAQLRTTLPVIPSALPNGVTDARLYRMIVTNFTPDLHFKN